MPGGESGGVEQFVLGLVRSLGRLTDGTEEYVVVAHPDAPGWLEPWLGTNQRLVAGPPPSGRLRRVLRGTSRRSPLATDGFFESLGVGVAHFPYQSFVDCRLPTVYNPHDLQHRHYPEFFAAEQLAWRERVHTLALRRATAVAAESHWAAQDVVREYAVDPGKIFVVPRGTPTDLYEPPPDALLAEVRRAFSLPPDFALYPARAWPHKNHLRLLEALAVLRDGGLRLDLVCTGKPTGHWAQVEARARELGLESHVHALGFVEPVELRALYRLARLVVVPSLFEGGGFPVLEAFREGTPVACSSATALPETAGDAALLFDPESVEDMAQALGRLAAEEDLRATLAERGTRRISLLDWERTARAYRALYRNVAGLALSAEDSGALAGSASQPTAG